MRVGYARVSSKDQSFDLQLDVLKKAKCDEIFKEGVSGAKTARPVLDDLLFRLRSGDVLVIWKLDRLGRSLKHLVTLTTELWEGQIDLISLNGPIDTTTAPGRLVFNIFAALAEFERALAASGARLAWRLHEPAGEKAGVVAVSPNRLKPRPWPRKHFTKRAS